MTVQQTSLDSFRSIWPEIGQRQMQVYLALKEMGEGTNLMISRKTGIPINVVTPRMNELVKAGLVVESYKDRCVVSKRTAIFWKVRQ